MSSVPGTEQQNGQQRPARSAAAIFDLLIEAVDGVAPPTAGKGPPGKAPGLDEVRAGILQSVDLYSDLFRQVLGLYTDAVQGLLERNGRQQDTPTAVELSGRPGGTAGTRLWVHNAAPEALSAVQLRLTDLFAHDGARLTAAGSAGFDPPTVAVPSGGQAATWLEVVIPPDLGPGTYHGYALATGLPEAVVPVRLVVVR